MATNPRGRNLVQQSAHMTAPAKLPSIPPGATPFERPVKEVLDVMLGRTGNPFEKVATQRDLSNLGLNGGYARDDIPTDQTGVLIGTTRGKFELLTLLGLANALAEYLPAGDGDVTQLEFQSLKKTVARLQGGLSETEVAALLRRAEASLEQRFNAAIAAAGENERGLIAELAESVTRIYEELRRKIAGYVHTQSVAAAVWTVAHGLERFPTVTVIDSAGDQVHADINYPDLDTVVITHGAAMTGTALFR